MFLGKWKPQIFRDGWRSFKNLPLEQTFSIAISLLLLGHRTCNLLSLPLACDITRFYFMQGTVLPTCLFVTCIFWHDRLSSDNEMKSAHILSPFLDTSKYACTLPRATIQYGWLIFYDGVSWTRILLCFHVIIIFESVY